MTTVANRRWELAPAGHSNLEGSVPVAEGVRVLRLLDGAEVAVEVRLLDREVDELRMLLGPVDDDLRVELAAFRKEVEELKAEHERDLRELGSARVQVAEYERAFRPHREVTWP